MAIRSGNHKLVSNGQQDQNPPELYNISLDLDESTNIKSEESKVYKNLLKEWEQWNSEMKDRVFPTLGGDKWWIGKD